MNWYIEKIAGRSTRPVAHNTTEITEKGIDGKPVTWRTGTPVQFNYMRNTEKSPYAGSVFGQDTEPHGRYMSHNTSTPPDRQLKNYEHGQHQFQNPLVIHLHTHETDPTGQRNIYGPDGWKARLSRAYGGKKGKALAMAIVKDGYDGIVTVDAPVGNKIPAETSEIVDLSMFMPRKTAQVNPPRIINIYRGTGPEGLKGFRPTTGINGEENVVFFYTRPQDAAAYAERNGGILVCQVDANNPNVEVKYNGKVVTVQNADQCVTIKGTIPTEKTLDLQSLDQQAQAHLNNSQ